jgi:DNA-binding transcriptional ArsR family regulator
MTVIDAEFARDMARAFNGLASRMDGSNGAGVSVGPDDAGGPSPLTALEAALAHVRGHRQRQVLEVVASKGEGGANTGEISRAIKYDQPNVYNTLHELKTKGLVVLIEGSSPQRWRLTG